MMKTIVIIQITTLHLNLCQEAVRSTCCQTNTHLGPDIQILKENMIHKNCSRLFYNLRFAHLSYLVSGSIPKLFIRNNISLQMRNVYVDKMHEHFNLINFSVPTCLLVMHYPDFLKWKVKIVVLSSDIK